MKAWGNFFFFKKSTFQLKKLIGHEMGIQLKGIHLILSP